LFNSTLTKLYDETWYLTMISDLWNCCKSVARSIACSTY